MHVCHQHRAPVTEDCLWGVSLAEWVVSKRWVDDRTHAGMINKFIRDPVGERAGV